MKMHHPHYGNQKLKTPWGEIQCDASGIADISKDAQDFFQSTLKFKPVSVDILVEAPVAHEAIEDDEDLIESEEETEDADGNSRFAKKSHAPKPVKKAGHKK
jgi:hypothetical protein